MSYIINYVESLNRFFGFFCSYTWRSAIPQGLGCRKHHRTWPMTWLTPWPTTLTKFPRTRTSGKPMTAPWFRGKTMEKKHVFSMSLAVVKSKIVKYVQLSMALSSTSTFRLLRTQHRTRRLSCSCQMVGWHSMNWRYKLAVSLRQNGVCWILNSCISFHFTRDTRVIVLVPCNQWQLCALATAAHLLQRVSKPTDSARGEDELLMTRQIHQRLPRTEERSCRFFAVHYMQNIGYLL